MFLFSGRYRDSQYVRLQDFHSLTQTSFGLHSPLVSPVGSSVVEMRRQDVVYVHGDLFTWPLGVSEGMFPRSIPQLFYGCGGRPVSLWVCESLSLCTVGITATGEYPTKDLGEGKVCHRVK